MVSVIIPSYNCAHLVADAINSVLRQTYDDVEAVVVDDGSADNTREVVGAMAAQDTRVVYVRQENKGLGEARNAGIAKARGDYLAFLDADDLFLPNKVRLQMEALTKDPGLGLVAGGHRFVDVSTGQVLAERRPWQGHASLNLETWLLGCPIVTGAVVMRTEWARRVRGFSRLQPPGAEDRDMWLRLVYEGCRMAWTPEIVCAYRMHAGQMTRNGRAQNESTLLALERFYGQPSLKAEVGAARSRSFAAAYLSGAFREYGASQIEDAQESLTRAIELNPKLLDGDPPAFVHTMIGWALEPYHGDAVAFVERVLDHLPPLSSAASASLFRHRKRTRTMTAVWATLDALAVGNTALARQRLTDFLSQPGTVDTSPDVLAEVIVACAKTLPRDGQIACAQQLFDIAPRLQAARNKTLARLYMARAFEASANRAVEDAGRAAREGVQLDPAWLRNRGVLSILIKSWRI